MGIKGNFKIKSKNPIYRKLRSFFLLLILSAALLLVMFLYLLWDTMDCRRDEREIRVAVNKTVIEIEDQVKENGGMKEGADLCVDSPFPYIATDLYGNVVFCSIEAYSGQENIRLSTLGSLSYYEVPITIGKMQCGLLVFDTENSRSGSVSVFFFLPASIGAVLFFIILFCLFKCRQIARKDMIFPVEELGRSVHSILNGNFDTVVSYDYLGEIGELCHNFELMRDELKSSRERELEWKKKERMMYASISHDLKTPIAVISGHLEEIRYGVAETPEEIMECVDLGLKKIRLLDKLVDDVLEHSKAELNQLAIQRTEVYAKAYIEDILKEYQREGIDLAYNEIPNVMLFIDPGRIQQVFQNVIGNSIKYAKQDGVHIEVETEYIEENDRVLIVRIKDFGIGINAKDLPFVFDMFYRGNHARTQDVPGSGIGLNTSRYIISKHGGEIECDSILGVGTTVTFSLPVL